LFISLALAGVILVNKPWQPYLTSFLPLYHECYGCYINKGTVRLPYPVIGQQQNLPHLIHLRNGFLHIASCSGVKGSWHNRFSAFSTNQQTCTQGLIELSECFLILLIWSFIGTFRIGMTVSLTKDTNSLVIVA